MLGAGSAHLDLFLRRPRTSPVFITTEPIAQTSLPSLTPQLGLVGSRGCKCCVGEWENGRRCCVPRMLVSRIQRDSAGSAECTRPHASLAMPPVRFSLAHRAGPLPMRVLSPQGWRVSQTGQTALHPPVCSHSLFVLLASRPRTAPGAHLQYLTNQQRVP